MGLVEEGLGADRKAKTNIAGTSVRAPFLIQSIPTTLSNRSTRQWRRYCEQSDVSFETHLRLMLPIVANCLCGSVSTEGLPPRYSLELGNESSKLWQENSDAN
ncbi:uncharacterized protein LOC126409922 isoform X2 [Nymphaea colorata]|uniref:uncharacterized protein LOC126409922 isoform X2 n=1 Tax=Nymphaea colorata TaxID=210225 RepID=UPI00214E00FE|nr:uncharacterized protein LOC126409922 isoform X2 [Nymphaea colorata]